MSKWYNGTAYEVGFFSIKIEAASSRLGNSIQTIGKIKYFTRGVRIGPLYEFSTPNSIYSLSPLELGHHSEVFLESFRDSSFIFSAFHRIRRDYNPNQIYSRGWYMIRIGRDKS